MRRKPKPGTRRGCRGNAWCWTETDAPQNRPRARSGAFAVSLLNLIRRARCSRHVPSCRIGFPSETCQRLKSVTGSMPPRKISPVSVRSYRFGKPPPSVLVVTSVGPPSRVRRRPCVCSHVALGFMSLARRHGFRCRQLSSWREESIMAEREVRAEGSVEEMRMVKRDIGRTRALLPVEPFSIRTSPDAGRHEVLVKFVLDNARVNSGKSVERWCRSSSHAAAARGVCSCSFRLTLGLPVYR